MTSPSETIFADEAGDLGLSYQPQIQRKPYYVVGFVYSRNPGDLRKHLRRLLKRLHISNKYPRLLTELKFYLPYTELIKLGYTPTQLNTQYMIHMPIIRTKAINIICKYGSGIFAAVIDKRKAKATWTTETLGNFVFAETVVSNIMNKLSLLNSPIILYDKGRLSPFKTTLFQKYVLAKDQYFQRKGWKKYGGSLSTPIDVSSNLEPGIWAADITSGAYYHKYTNNDWTYANMFSNVKIGLGERLYWP